ncbi:hypothetical protein [Croceicoccus sp. Ery5]|jgi:hypothetical protein|uniref:hypothetical protein n=1 Tax=Croceicoccus sp. Ery5 TaxID=1703340 RepID=UPI001E3B63E0|nr:hypothetical protein [Croceicoccus sp. Ery5]
MISFPKVAGPHLAITAIGEHLNGRQLLRRQIELANGSSVGDSGFMLGWERINLTREYRWPKSLA